MTVAFRVAILALLAGSCAKTLEPEGDGWTPLGGDCPVLFRSDITEPATKASLPAGTSFGVFAYYTKTTNWNYAGGSTVPNFMYNEEVTFSGTSYTYSPIKYWPNNTNEKVSFWAYYPYSADVILFKANSTTTAFNNNTKGLPDIQFTVTDGQTDFMISNVAANKTKPSINTPVELTFNHALSLIDVFVQKKDDPDDDYTVTLNSVRFNGLYMTGILKSSDWSWDSYSGSRQSILVWEDPSDVAIAKLENGVSHSIGSVMPLPQSLSSNLTRLQVVFTLSSTSPQFNRTTTENVFLKDVFTTAPYQWNMNAHYTLTIRISPNRPIEFTVSWSDWGDVFNYSLTD